MSSSFYKTLHKYTPTRSLVQALFDNPILYYEGLLRTVRRARERVQVYGATGIILFTTFIALYVFMIDYNGRHVAAYGFWMMLLWALLTIIISSLHMARVIIAARDNGNWDALLLTHLRPVEIITGKLLSALLPFWLSLVLLLPSFVILYLGAQGSNYEISIHIVKMYGRVIIISFACAALALYCSMRSKTIGNAYLLTILALLGTWLLATIIQVIYYYLMQSYLFGGDIGLRLSAFSFLLILVTNPLLQQNYISGYVTSDARDAMGLWWLAYALPGLIAFAYLLIRFKKLDRAQRH